MIFLTCDRSVGDHSAAWSNLWDTDNSDMWDRGKPSPALIDLVERNKDFLNPVTADGRRKRALVPVRQSWFPLL
jgi:hypothetical protein